MLLRLCTKFQVFALFALQSSPMKLYFWYLSCKHFPEITHQYILFALLFLHLKHFETSALLCVVKRILLDIRLNLRYSLILLSQTSNFPYSLKKICLLYETIFVEEFYIFTKRGAESALFFFCYSFKVLLFSKNQIRLLCKKPNAFSTVKLALCVQSLCLLPHDNFFVFNTSDNCWKSSHNLWTLPNHNFRVTWGLRFPSMLQRFRSIFYRPVLKTKRSGETTGKCSLWDDG